MDAGITTVVTSKMDQIIEERQNPEEVTRTDSTENYEQDAGNQCIEGVMVESTSEVLPLNTMGNSDFKRPYLEETSAHKINSDADSPNVCDPHVIQGNSSAGRSLIADAISSTASATNPSMIDVIELQRKRNSKDTERSEGTTELNEEMKR